MHIDRKAVRDSKLIDQNKIECRLKYTFLSFMGFLQTYKEAKVIAKSLKTKYLVKKLSLVFSKYLLLTPFFNHFNQ
jgi:hypothetical protein